MERVFSGTLKGLLLFRLENIGCLIQNMTLMIRNDDFEKVLSCVLIHTHRSTHQGPIFDESLDASKRLDSSDICTKFDGIFLYLSSGCDKEEILGHLETWIVDSTPTFIMGDFNIDLARKETGCTTCNNTQRTTTGVLGQPHNAGHPGQHRMKW